MICSIYREGDESGVVFNGTTQFHVHGQAWSVRDGSDVVAIIGGVCMWGKVCVVYAHVAESINKNRAISLVRMCMACIDILHIQFGYEKFQAFVDATNATNMKFIEALGFKKEGTMALAMPDGADCAIYGRLA